MARLANIVPESANSFDPRRHLTHGDVAVTSHGPLVAFNCTKPIQIGEHRLHIPLLIRLVPDCRRLPFFSF